MTRNRKGDKEAFSSIAQFDQKYFPIALEKEKREKLVGSGSSYGTKLAAVILAEIEKHFEESRK